MNASEGTQLITASEAKESSALALEDAKRLRREIEAVAKAAEKIIDKLTFQVIAQEK